MKISDEFQIAGMALAAIIGIILNLVLPGGEAVQDNHDPLEEENNTIA